jgi:hypothetical protein
MGFAESPYILRRHEDLLAFAERRPRSRSLMLGSLSRSAGRARGLYGLAGREGF